MEAWITYEMNRKFSKVLETLLLFLLIFFHVPESVKASLTSPHAKIQKNHWTGTVATTPLSASYTQTHLRGNHSLTPAIYHFYASS